MDGFEFISNSRAAKRGGGVGIVVNNNLGYRAKKLQVNCRVGSSSLEIVWALVTPPKPINGTMHPSSARHIWSVSLPIL